MWVFYSGEPGNINVHVRSCMTHMRYVVDCRAWSKPRGGGGVKRRKCRCHSVINANAFRVSEWNMVYSIPMYSYVPLDIFNMLAPEKKKHDMVSYHVKGASNWEGIAHSSTWSGYARLCHVMPGVALSIILQCPNSTTKKKVFQKQE